MKERPILFNSEMIYAILEGRKTQTRRLVKPQPKGGGVVEYDKARKLLAHYYRGAMQAWNEAKHWVCPYGKPGDLLWARETWADCGANTAAYKSGSAVLVPGVAWRPSIHMPRWASRITLRVEDIRVERLRNIPHNDAIDEGIRYFETDDGEDGYYAIKQGGVPCSDCPVDVFKMLWNSINAAHGFGWEANPLVWTVTFSVKEIRK